MDVDRDQSDRPDDNSVICNDFGDLRYLFEPPGRDQVVCGEIGSEQDHEDCDDHLLGNRISGKS